VQFAPAQGRLLTLTELERYIFEIIIIDMVFNFFISKKKKKKNFCSWCIAVITQ